MNKLTLQILDKASEDMQIINKHISNDNPEAAKKLLKKFNKTFEVLSYFPNLGTTRKDFNYKNVKFYVLKKKYLIIYKVIDNELYILRVLATYQDVCSLL